MWLARCMVEVFHWKIKRFSFWPKFNQQTRIRGERYIDSRKRVIKVESGGGEKARGHKSGSKEQRPRELMDSNRDRRWWGTQSSRDAARCLLHIWEVQSYIYSAPLEQDSNQMWQATSLDFKEHHLTLSVRAHKCPLVIWIYEKIKAVGESATSLGQTVSDCAACRQTNTQLDDEESEEEAKQNKLNALKWYTIWWCSCLEIDADVVCGGGVCGYRYSA